MSNQEQFWQDLRSGKFVSMVKESSKGHRLSNAREVYNVLKPIYARHPDVEAMYCIFMDAKNQVLGIEKMFSGSITSAPIYPREIVKQVLSLGASALIMAHNHPSGCVVASADDRAITVKVYVALNSIDTALHDHLIIGDGFFSMADAGWLKTIADRYKTWLQG